MAICPLIGINVSNAKIKTELPQDLKKLSKASPDELSFEVLDSALSVILKESLAFPDDGELQCVNWIEVSLSLSVCCKILPCIITVPLNFSVSGVLYFRCPWHCAKMARI